MRVFALYLVSALLGLAPLWAIESVGLEEKISPEPQLGRQLALDLAVLSETGEVLSVEGLLQDGVPLLVVPVYYDCPRLCGLTQGGVADLVGKLQLEVGTDYKVVSVSIDATEQAPLAKKRAIEFRKKAGLTSPEQWHFAVIDKNDQSRFVDQLGFRYLREKSGELAHSAALYVVTPEGKIGQFFSGIRFSPWDVKLALVEASQGKIGTLFDQALLYCFHFDPLKGRYTWAAWNFARLGSLLSVVLFVYLVFYFVRKTS